MVRAKIKDEATEKIKEIAHKYGCSFEELLNNFYNELPDYKNAWLGRYEDICYRTISDRLDLILSDCWKIVEYLQSKGFVKTYGIRVARTNKTWKQL